MAEAEGRALPFGGPEEIDMSVLETFGYDGPEQEIITETHEFSAVCPYSGLPDYAVLTIRYVPAARCVELKSLKYYVTSYRNVGIYQEHATARIAEDLYAVLQPSTLTVTTTYNPRGGFETTCTVTLPATAPGARAPTTGRPRRPRCSASSSCASCSRSGVRSLGPEFGTHLR